MASEYTEYKDAAEFWIEQGDEREAIEATREAVRAAGWDPSPLSLMDLHWLADRLPRDPKLVGTAFSPYKSIPRLAR